MNFKTMQIEDIIAWCAANNQTAWLKEEAARMVACKVYPRVKGEDGKVRADKSQEPKIEMRKITFIQIKTDFVNKFMPEIAPKAKAKKASMYDIIAAL
jgi:hypothetical protein